jgi:hypothetical protein
VNIIEVSRSVLISTPKRWLEIVETLPADLLYRRPAEGEWSAMECLGHLVDTEAGVFSFRVGCILDGMDFPAFDPDNKGNEIPAPGGQIAFAEKFAQLRKDGLKVFEGIKTQDLEKTALHSELGRVTLGELLHEWAGHDLMHTVQAERALMQPFINGCGPWQQYFLDHWVR